MATESSLAPDKSNNDGGGRAPDAESAEYRLGRSEVYRKSASSHDVAAADEEEKANVLELRAQLREAAQHRRIAEGLRSKAAQHRFLAELLLPSSSEGEPGGVAGPAH